MRYKMISINTLVLLIRKCVSKVVALVSVRAVTRGLMLYLNALWHAHHLRPPGRTE